MILLQLNQNFFLFNGTRYPFIGFDSANNSHIIVEYIYICIELEIFRMSTKVNFFVRNLQKLLVHTRRVL